MKDNRKTISLLRRAAGSTINTSTLYSQNQRPLKTNNKKKKFVKESSTDELLNLLETVGLIKSNKKKTIVKKNFSLTGRLSVASAGQAFLRTGAKNADIMIPLKHRQGARHFDRVEVQLEGLSPRGLYGRVIKIVARFANEFSAEIIERHNSYTIIRMIDQPECGLALLKINKYLQEKTIIKCSVADFSVRDYPRQSKSGEFIQPKLYKFISVIDPETSKGNLERVALKYQIPLSYPNNLTPDKKALNQFVKQGMKDKTRRNLSKLYTITIDGAEAKDFDDAISVEKTKSGYKLWVHIADVSHFIEKNNSLDKEALTRSNSYYLANNVLPMLPYILSEDYCSLRPKTKRLAVTCEMSFNLKGEMKKFHFYKSFIYVNKRFTYKKAEAELDKKKSPLKAFWLLAQILIELRQKNGKINLTLPENKLIFKNQETLVDIKEADRFRSHLLIEEFMVSANIASGQFARENNLPLLNRNHEAIPAENIVKINAFLKLYGANLQIKDLSHEQIKKAIVKMQGNQYESIFHYLLLRSFSQANYGLHLTGHWGLALKDYAHFTSPIRRFADLTVHRQILSYTKNKKLAYTKEELEIIGIKISENERLAMEAERTIIKLFAIQYFKSFKNQTTYEATLTGFNKKGLFLQLTTPPVEVFSPLNEGDEFITIDDFRVNLPHLQKTLFLGTKVLVKITDINWQQIRIYSEVVKVQK